MSSNTTTITVSVETWTPATAQAALGTQIRNRNLSETAVRRYRNDMIAGRWPVTGEALKFDTGGHLIDGQHRAHALAGCPDDVTVDFLVIRGLDEHSQMFMDQGLARKTGQQLGMVGIKHGNTVAAGVKFLLTVKTGLLFRDNKLAQEVITKAVVEEWVANNGDSVEALNPLISKIKAADAPPTVGYCAALLFHEKSPAAVGEFFEILANGGAPADHPITVLDKRLQRHRREGIRISNRDMLGLYIQAWNAWHKGAKFTRFQRPRGGHWTEATFPKPVAA